MLCSIDPERCYDAASGWNVWVSLGVVALVMVAVTVLYEFREFIGGVLVLLVGAAILYSIGLLQVLFVGSFVPPAFLAWISFIMKGDASLRIIHPIMWGAAALALGGYAIAIVAHDLKVVAILVNLMAVVVGIYGYGKTKWPPVEKT